MKIAEQLPIDQVISEWLKAEWYKSYFDGVREELSPIVLNPDLMSEEENKLRKDLLISIRHDFVSPLYTLNINWYCVTISKREEYESLFIIPANDWYTVTGTTFRLKDAPDNLQNNTYHRADIEKKVVFLQSHSRFDQRTILVGSSEEDLTIIEGNHRMIASLIYMQKNNISDFPQKVIVGFTQNIAQYRWSKKWKYFDEFLALRQREEESFRL